jgi:uncharacterized protein YfaS (alpha-2-macroglobulin family)/TolA-binding protein
MQASKVRNAGLICWLLASLALSQTPAGPSEIDDALQRRDFVAAIQRIDAALPQAKGMVREYLLYRRGLALVLSNQPEDAIQQFEAQVKEFPDGAWAHKARFRTADAHASLKQHDAAEKIYADEVRMLVGDDRKARLARVYQDFAEEYFEPKDSLIKPDFAKARTFYEKALELEPGEGLREAILYRRALCNQKLEAWADAGNQFHDYLLIFDPAYREVHKSRFAGTPLPKPAAKPGANLLEARFALGQCRLRLSQFVDARRVFQDLLTVLKSEQTAADGARRQELTIDATYLISKTYGIPTPADSGMLTLGVQTLKGLIQAYPESKQAVQAAHDIAAANMHLGRTDAAIAAYRALVDRTSIRPNTDATRTLAETLAQDALFTIGRLLFQQKKYAEAIGVWNQYIARYPSGPQWSAAQQAILDAEFQMGADAVAAKRYDEGREAWEAFLQKYPLDRRAPGILYMFGELATREQTARKEKGETPDWTVPIGLWRKLVSKYPGTEEAGRGQFSIAYTLETSAKDLEAAIVEYTKLNWSGHAAEAQRRLAELRATRLSVLSERVFRTDEIARVKVDLRNIEALTVKLYRLDMEDFFRKSHGLAGVDALDLVLIDPDQTIEIPVKEYGKYKPVSQEIELPFEGPAVYAVTVTNEKSKLAGTAGIQHAKLEATALIIRSDIDVIVKSSRKQMLVFAQNMRTGKPAAGVNVLVSAALPPTNPGDGAAPLHKVFLSGKTGEDGVWLGKSDDLKNAAAPIVLATLDGHTAGAGISLESLGLSSGLLPRGYLYTDRPAYRPGEAVNIRGILREVKDGQYALPDQPEDVRQHWQLDVVDAKGRVLRTNPIQLTDVGSFAAQFRIGADAPLGEYKLIARRAGGPTFAGAFTVQQFDLPKAFVQVELDEPAVLRGQPIKGSVVVKYQYGEPVTGKTVEYSLAATNGETIQRTGVTDKSGKISFEFDSTTLPEEGSAIVSARQAELQIEGRALVAVAVRAFRAAVSTQRPLYLSEEPVEVKVSATDLKGKPIKQELTLTAFHRVSTNGEWAETKIESAALSTDEKTGVARASLKLVKGGQYALRVEGKDKFEHIVTAEAAVQISDAEDETRLRLFSERETYKVGETVALDVHSRITTSHQTTEPRSHEGQETLGEPGAKAAARDRPPLLALVTYEGEEIIGYRTLAIADGHNALEISLANEHFPNFAVGVGVMAGNHFYSASREFSIQRQLNIVMTPIRARSASEGSAGGTAGASAAKADDGPLVLRPRDTLAVEINVTDHLGKPVSAEVGLSMIDNALLTRFPDNTPEIVGFFQDGARRQAALRTQASCTFRFAAASRPMVSDVLAEAERLIETAGKEIAAAMPPPPARPGQQAARGMWEGAAGRAGGDIAGGQAGASMFSAGAAGEDDDQNEQLQQGAKSIVRAPKGGAAKYRELTRSHMEKNGDGAEDILELLEENMPQHQAVLNIERAKDAVQQLDTLRNDIALGLRVSFGADLREFDKKAAEVATQAPPRTFFPDVAYWNPRVMTDAAGKATVSIVLPDSSTKWKLIARGVTKETLVGGGEAEVIAKQDFFVELMTPATLVQGDVFRPAARVHCQTPYNGKVRVKLTANTGLIDGREPKMEMKQEIEIAGAGVYDVEFGDVPLFDEKQKLAQQRELLVEIEALSLTPPPGADKPLLDVSARAIPVRPWGMRVEAHRAGVGRDSDFVEIDLTAPEGLSDLHDRVLSLVVGASMPRWLIEEALETGPRWIGIERSLSAWRITPPRTNADTASALLGALYASDYVRATKPRSDGATKEKTDTESADSRLLDERIAALIAQLLTAQNDDGGIAWCGAKASDPWTTSVAAWAIGKARRNGYSVADAAVQKLAQYLQASFAAAGAEQTEFKAILLHGIAWISEADFAHANRLYRQRDTLSTASLAHLTLTFLRLDRKPIAAELLGVLEHRLREERNGRDVCKCVPATGCSDWMSSTLEVTALALLAQLEVDPRNANVKPMVSYLASAARADGWRPHKARGPVLAALCTYYGGAQLDAAAYELTVLINGKELKKLTANDSGSVRFDLSAGDLPAGKQRIDFRFSGRGEYAYAATLSGFATAFPGTIRNSGEPVWADMRWYNPPAKEYKGRDVPNGFGVTSRSNWFVNRAAKVPQGKAIRVQVNYGRHESNSLNRAGDADYIVVQEAIPAGFRLLEDTLSGPFLSYDYADNVLTLYYGSQHGIGNLQYYLVATTPGTYRVPPTILRSLYRPDRYNLNQADTITVLPRDSVSDDPYRPTPDELYHLARMNFDDGGFDEAAKLLKDLLAPRDWTLHDEPYRESIRMLLACSLARDDAEGIVNYFEILKEKYPTLLVPFEQIVRVAAAYGKTNQHERAYLIYRATADASYTTDIAIGGVLQAEGRFLEGVDFLERLWHEFPDTPQVESLHYAMTQTLYAQADRAAALQQRRRAKGGTTGELPAKVTKAAIVQETIELLERFLALHPTSPIADEASYSLANAYLDLDQFDTVITRTQRMIETFPKSKWLDRYRYIQALAHFHLGHFEEARTLAEQVATAKIRDEQGVERPSPNQWLALYIIGQIYHAKGDAAKAIEYYRKVKEQFSDAGEALAWFERRFVSLPEVTILHPDEQGYRESEEWLRHLRARKLASGADSAVRAPGAPPPAAANHVALTSSVRPIGSSGPSAPLYNKPFIELGYRNTKSAVLQVYRVDLMKLALVEKNLSQITAVNLSGIKPMLEKTVALGDGMDYVDKSLRIDLDLPAAKDADGAYLVICRGDDLFASGLVLVTPLALDVQDEPGSPRVRVNVVDAITRGGVKDVHVKVIGTGMARFVSGETDLRGVFAAEPVSGFPTAIARDSRGHFAFYRSEGAMIAMATPLATPKTEPATQGKNKADYRGNLSDENRKFQMENDARMQQIYKAPQQRGVEVQRAQ